MPDEIRKSTRQWLSDTSFLLASLGHTGLSDAQSTLSNGVCVDYPAPGVMQLTPPTDFTDSLLLTAGVHGNETAPIELMDQLAADLLNERLVPQCRLMLVFANLAAIDTQQRFVRHNMNRLFASEKHGSSRPDAEANSAATDYETQRALDLQQLSKNFFSRSQGRCVHYDLHTAIRQSRHEKFAVSPNLASNSQLSEQIERLGQMGIEAVLNGANNGTTFSAFTARECGACSFTLELGQVRPFGGNDLSTLSNFDNTLRALIDPTQENTNPNPRVKTIAPVRYLIREEIIKQSEQFTLNFADDAPNFTRFPKGAVLAQDGERMYRTSSEGECIVFPNAKVAIGQRALLVVRPDSQTTAVHSDRT